MMGAYAPAGSLRSEMVGERWVLVLGGVTRVGNRRARRAASEALESGYDVVWFDGFEEKAPETSERVPVDHGGAGRLQIVGFAEAEAETLAGRLRSGRALQAPGLRVLWRYFLRRIGSILRARSCWTTIRPDVRRLTTGVPPAAIICCDDYSITSAWYAGRMWAGAPISTQFPMRAE